jgi:hypothetical protein
MASLIVRFDLEIVEGEDDKGVMQKYHNIKRKEDKDTPRVFPAVMVKSEKIGVIREYADDHLIVGCEMNPNLYVFKNLVQTVVVRGGDPTQLTTRAIRILKNFHPENFPFMVCNGSKGIDLVSINSGVRQPLIAFSNLTNLGTPVAVFPDECVACEWDAVHMVF